jgi:hypothetical protein
VRQLIQEIGGVDISEKALLEQSLQNGNAGWIPGDINKPPEARRRPRNAEQASEWFSGDPGQPGATNNGDWKAILERNGVESEFVAPNPADTPHDQEWAKSIAEGKPVVVGVWGDYIVPDPAGGYMENPEPGNRNGSRPDKPAVKPHVVVVTAYELDSSGNVAAFYVNDTATGCGLRVSANALIHGEHAPTQWVRPKASTW